MNHSTTEEPQRGRLSRNQLVGLAAAPIVAGITRAAFWLPYPDEPTESAAAQYLSDIEGHVGRTQASALLMIAASLLLIPVGFALNALLRSYRPRMARIGSALAVVGATAGACMSVPGMFAAEMAQSGDRDAMANLWSDFMNDSAGEVIFFAVVAGAVGFIVLAVGLYRSHAVPRAAAVLTGVGGAGLLVTAPGPARGFLVAAAVIAAAGFGWIATSVSPASVLPVAGATRRGSMAVPS